MKKILSKSLLIIFGVLIGVLFSEIILRVYNPLPTRVEGKSIRLLTNYERTVDIDMGFQQVGLEESIHYSTNSISFRGDEPPLSFSDYYTIFTVGGSTTECSLLDDTKTWSHQLYNLLSNEKDSIWINNAGIDGCSTHGHQILLSEHIFKYKPNMIILLVGVNEMHVAQSVGDDFLNTTREYRLRKLAQKSELFSFIWAFYRQKTSRNNRVGHSKQKLLDDLSYKNFKSKYKLHLDDQKKYKQRLNILVKDCINRRIEVVLVTQPIYNLTEYHPYSFVQMYNQTTIEIGKENNLVVIDLASQLEDNPDYYYDPLHYTNIGAEKIAQIIKEQLVNKFTFTNKK